MLLPSVRVKRVASASLVLGGAVAGCGGDSDPNESTARRLCNFYQDCFADEFDNYYDTFQECVLEQVDDFEDAERDYGASCGVALRALENCYVSEDRGMCMDFDDLEDLCEAEYDAYYDACYD
jgi:hypothetical protein